MEFIQQFQDPPSEFSASAFWFWNGLLNSEKLAEQIDEMIDKGVFSAFMHARAYLKTPYLGEEWWQAVGGCIKKGTDMGFHPWLYDEYAWPSGTAGSTFDYSYQKKSRVLSQGESNMAKGLKAVAIEVQDTLDIQKELFSFGKPLAAYETVSEPFSVRRLTAWKNGSVEKGKIITAFYREIYPKSVDYLNKDTIRYFLNLTHEEYKKRFGKSFGSIVPGVFFDEIYNAAILPWTDSFPREFEIRMGYDLLDHLPCLINDGGSYGRKVRKDYFQILSQLYEEAFFKQIADWCAENNLMLTGHTEESLLTHPRRQGNYFQTMRHLQIPGADCHDYRYHFPRKITYCEPKYAVSVARAYGKSRCMSEAMGGAGWGCSLQQFKRGINTMGAMGINMFVLHGFYYECDTQGSQADWPTSFFYQNPYWKYFKIFADYMRRVSYMNSIGQPVIDVAIWYPIEEVQANTIAGRPNSVAAGISNGFHRVLNALLERQIDVDMLDSASILRAEIKNGCLCVGKEAFHILLMPAKSEITAGLLDKLDGFQKLGGKVLQYSYSGDTADFEFNGAYLPEKLPEVLDKLFIPDIYIAEGGRTNLYVNHRKWGNKDFYFISNSSEQERTVKLRVRVKGKAKKLNPENGLTEIVHFDITQAGTEIRLHLDADEACWILLEDQFEKNVPDAWTTAETIAIAHRWNFLPLGKEYQYQWNIDAEETSLVIPMALLSDSIHTGAQQIRICNRENEPGFLGSHLSLWKASWISRRPSWQDDCTGSDLFFRRKVILPDIPEKARFCIAAVNEFTIYINDKMAGHFVCYGKPTQIEAANLFCAGENMIAVHVHNSTPLSEINLCSVENIPKGVLISLLLQADICVNGETMVLVSDSSWIVNNQEQMDWEKGSSYYEKEAVQADACQYPSFGAGEKDGTWLFAWERGRPPMLPWGDLPLFETNLPYPVSAAYNVILPAGTTQVLEPEVQGKHCCFIDNMPINWSNGTYKLSGDPYTHHLAIQITAGSSEDGLKAPVKVKVVPFVTPLCDWRLHGLTWFSGFGLYRSTVKIQHKKKGRYLLDLGDVRFQAEIWINGALAGTRIWAPYRLDITDFLTEGENRLAIVISNSAAVERRHMLVDEGMALGWNRYWNEDNIDRESENLFSGLFGPVKIYYQILERTL